MSRLTRTGIALDDALLAKFDRVIRRKGYQNRSEAIRDLVRDCVVTEDVESNREVVGTLTMVYDHHKPGLSQRITGLQHDAEHTVLAATHVHLDHRNCLEVVLLKGPAVDVQRFAEGLLSLRGVKHGKLALTTTGKGLT